MLSCFGTNVPELYAVVTSLADLSFLFFFRQHHSSSATSTSTTNAPITIPAMAPAPSLEDCVGPESELEPALGVGGGRSEGLVHPKAF